MSQGHNPMQSHQGGLVGMPTPAPQAGAHKTMFGSFDLSGASKAIAIIGRLPSCDIVLPYPQVSSRHTSVMRAPDGTLIVGDMGSTNGTYVNGQRLVPGQTIAVAPKTKIFIGPYPVMVDLQGNAIAAYIEQESQFESANLVEIEALDLFLEGARPGQAGHRQDPPQPRHLQGAAGRHDRADGPVGRRQDHAAHGAQRLPAAHVGRGARQRREPLRHLRRAPREHRLRARRTTSCTPSSRCTRPSATARSSACRRTTRTRRSSAASSRR